MCGLFMVACCGVGCDNEKRVVQDSGCLWYNYRKFVLHRLKGVAGRKVSGKYCVREIVLPEVGMGMRYHGKGTELWTR